MIEKILLKKGINLIWLMLLGISVKGQYFNFSQYDQTPLRINPAYVAASDYQQLNVIYRQQKTSEVFDINSINLSYHQPARISRSERLALGIGITAMNDKTGGEALMNKQHLGIAAGVNVEVGEGQTLNMGFSGLAKMLKFSLDGLTTESQYGITSGHNPDASIGENFSDDSKFTFGLNAGILWQKTDKNRNRLAHVGIATFDLNQPNEYLIGPDDNHLQMTHLLQLGMRVYNKNGFSIYPRFLAMYSGKVTNINPGAIWEYDLSQQKNVRSLKVALLTNYVIDSYANVGLRFSGKNFIAGVSYDIGFRSFQEANNGALEVSFVYRRLMRTKHEPMDIFEGLDAIENESLEIKDGSMDNIDVPIVDTELDEEPKVNDIDTFSDPVIDSEITVLDEYSPNTSAGDLIYRNVQMERLNIICEFDFDKDILKPEVSNYLQQLVDKISDKEVIMLEIIGHTDPVGSEEYNMELSARRAYAIGRFIAEQGIPWSKMSLTGKGESQPLPGNAPDHENRRVEVRIFTQL